MGKSASTTGMSQWFARENIPLRLPVNQVKIDLHIGNIHHTIVVEVEGITGGAAKRGQNNIYVLRGYFSIAVQIAGVLCEVERY